MHTPQTSRIHAPRPFTRIVDEVPRPVTNDPAPHIRLTSERVMTRHGDEIVVPMATLSFDYGAVRVRQADKRTHVSTQAGLAERNRDFEERCKGILESFGLIELDTLDDFARLTAQGDYIVDMESDVDALCSFSATAVPRLRKLGWSVDIDPKYPCVTADENATWYADADSDGPGWFQLELGVVIDGQRVNLLPVLVDLIEQDGARLEQFAVGVIVARTSMPPASRARGRGVWHTPLAAEAGPRPVEQRSDEPVRTLAKAAASAADSTQQQIALSMDALARARHRFVALPLGGTRYMPVPPERVQQIVRVLLELYNKEPLADGALRLPKGRVPVIDQLALAIDGLELDIDTKLGERASALTQSLPLQFVPPRGLLATLRPYQEEGVAWLEDACERGAGVILADDMGLGKTLQTITHILLQKERGRLDLPVLIVAPTSLTGNWQREIEKFAPSLRTAIWQGARRARGRAELAMADVIITSYPLIVRDTEVFTSLAFHMMILDEAQAVKSARSLAHKAVKHVITRHRVCLTGTPIENGLDELWSLFDVLSPGWLGSSESFKLTFQTPIEKFRNQHVMEALRERIRPFIKRRLKSDVAKDLPPKTELVRTVELHGAQRDLYESIRIAAHDHVRKAVKDRGVAGATIDILDALLKLRQVCCDPRLVSVPSARSVRESAKLDVLHEMVEENRSRGQKVLVFSQFATMLELIAKDFHRRDVPHAILTGATQNRQTLVDAFQRGDHDVFLISLKAGGTGLTLTAAETVIHYDPWWNPAVQAQATDRAYRIGQTKPVFAFNLVVAGSVEERILSLQRRKRELADGLLGAGALRDLTASDVESLFEPLDA